MTRRCGVLLPSGKSCPTFLSAEQNVCSKHRFIPPAVLRYPPDPPPRLVKRRRWWHKRA